MRPKLVQGYIESLSRPVELFAEPFVGGASVSLQLAAWGSVGSVLIVDRDPLVYSFGNTAAYDNEWLIDEMHEIEVSVPMWEEMASSEPKVGWVSSAGEPTMEPGRGCCASFEVTMADGMTTDDVQGLTEGFESFYSRTWSEIYRAVAIAVGEVDLAREAVDEAMTRAFEKWSSVSGMANPEGWVYRVAVNWSRSVLRRRLIGSRKRQNLKWSIEDVEVPDPQVVDAVRGLPVHQRDVVVARFLFDMSEKDTAEAFGIPLGTVKSRVNRALSTLGEALS